MIGYIPIIIFTGILYVLPPRLLLWQQQWSVCTEWWAAKTKDCNKCVDHDHTLAIGDVGSCKKYHTCMAAIPAIIIIWQELIIIIVHTIIGWAVNGSSGISHVIVKPLAVGHCMGSNLGNALPKIWNAYYFELLNFYGWNDSTVQNAATPSYQSW